MSHPKAYIGTVEDVVCTFKIASTGAVDDPVVVTLEVKAPTATKVTYTYGASGSPILRRSAGIYYIHTTYTEKGDWGWIWHGVGAGHAEGTQQYGRSVSARLFT